MGESLYGLIGFPLGHSFSKNYFSKKFKEAGLVNTHYELFPLQRIGLLPELISRFPHLKGLNVTIPYKETIIPFLDRLDQTAAKTGAVNVVKICKEGELVGYNTDYWGFKQSLLGWLNQLKKKVQSALIFGTGGSAKAVSYALDELHIPYKLVSRQKGVKPLTLTYHNLTPDLATQFDLLINCTPLGMHPEIHTCPSFPYEILNGTQLLYDLVYNPPQTTFLQKGNAAGCAVKNGLEMLILQAEKAWEIWKKSDIAA